MLLSSSPGDDYRLPSGSASQGSRMKLTLCKDQLPEMSQGLVLLHSLGIRRKMGRGWYPLDYFFFSEAPRCFLWGINASPTQRKIAFPLYRKQDISHFKALTTKKVYTNTGHSHRMHTWLVVRLFFFSLHDMWSLLFPCISARKSELNEHRTWRKCIFSHSQIVGCRRFML